MPTRVFLASPGDVDVERAAMPAVIDAINRDVGDLLGVVLELVRWETHAAPGAGRPQQVVFDDIGDYDAFIGLMWKRFGTLSKDEDSGTAEEYRDAYSRWQQDASLPLLFYFCEQPFYTNSLAELDQFRRVLVFREELEGRQLTWSYARHEDFAERVRGHLIQRIKQLKSRPSQRTAPDKETTELLRKLWPNLTADARSALSGAFNVGRLVGDGGIKTETLFTALDEFAQGDSRKVIDLVPDAAMPSPIPATLDPTPHILEEAAWFSPCVTDSLRSLADQAKPERPLTPADLFVDLAKNGRGSSVRRLRKNHIGPQEIDGIVRRSGVSVLARSAEASSRAHPL